MEEPAAATIFNFTHVQEKQDSAAHPTTMSIDKLFPALIECFGIILCGYVAGRANIITSTQAKGLGNFVSMFALPALLFKNMVLLDFGNVIWPFLWSILVAKVCVFAIVCVLTLIVASPDSRFSKAGIFSIFATQSNDFALGYPIGRFMSVTRCNTQNAFVCRAAHNHFLPNLCTSIQQFHPKIHVVCFAEDATIHNHLKPNNKLHF